jgi:hypothetical protein
LVVVYGGRLMAERAAGRSERPRVEGRDGRAPLGVRCSLTYWGGVWGWRLASGPGALVAGSILRPGRSRPAIPADRQVRPATTGQTGSKSLRTAPCDSGQKTDVSGRRLHWLQAIPLRAGLRPGRPHSGCGQTGSNQIKANQGCLGSAPARRCEPHWQALPVPLRKSL